MPGGLTRMLLGATLAAGLALAGSAAALPANPWTGQWLNSADGTTITLAQSGSVITGTSPCPGTTMFPAGVTQTGTVSGDGTAASFTYSGAPSCPGAAGTYQATMRPDARVIDVRGTTQFGTPFTATFTYQGGGTEPRETPTPPPPAPPPPAPPPPTPPTTPSGFDQTRSYPAPRPGRAKTILSPAIPRGVSVLGIRLAFTGPLGQGVTPVGLVGEPAGLTRVEADKLLKQRLFDRAFEKAFVICTVFGDYDPDLMTRAAGETFQRGPGLRDEGRALLRHLDKQGRRFEHCMVALTRIFLRRLPPTPPALSASAQAGGAGCAAGALPLVVRAKRGSRSVTVGVGSPRQARPRLKVGCAKTADGALALTVRTRKRSARLRDVVGRRLRIGVGRPRSGPRGRAGNGLNVTWSLPAG